MKKFSMRVISLLTVLCMLFLSGCQGQGVKTETPEEFWARPHEWKSDQLIDGNANEYGYYFVDSYSIFKYLDYKTKQTVALCNKVGCKHEDYNCEAFIRGFEPYIFFREEKLCLITDDEDGAHIYCCDLDATNRENKILLMKDEMEKGNATAMEEVLVNGNDLYYTAVYQEPIDEAGGEKKLPIKAIRHVNLKTWTEEEICRSVENIYSIIGADEKGVLISSKPDVDAFTKVDMDSFSEEEVMQGGIVLLTLEEREKLAVEGFYWNKETGDKLTLYQSNSRATSNLIVADGNYLYAVGRPDGSDMTGLEKINMLTGEAEWLWHKKAGEKCLITSCVPYNNKITLGITNEADNSFWTERYTIDGFQQVAMPFLKDYGSFSDTVSFEDEHGYIVWKNDPSGQSVDIIFVPIEEADKENPEYTLLYTYGME